METADQLSRVDSITLKALRKKGSEMNVSREAPMTPGPGWREPIPADSEERLTGKPAGKTASEIQKQPASKHLWFRDQNDLRRAIIWAEVIGQPVSRKLRRKRVSMDTGRR